MPRDYKIGFACKWVAESKDEVDAYNEKSTTVKHLSSLTKDAAYTKILGIVLHNLSSLGNKLTALAESPPTYRMMRIGSGFFPMYTHDSASWIYDDHDIKLLIENGLAKLGDFARLHNIRLSSHPGQYTVLNSLTPKVVDASIADFEYHCDIFRYMGYTDWHQDGLDVNVHGGPKASSIEHLIHTINTRLSSEARKWITIENDEYSYGIDDLLVLKDTCPIIFDTHHHWIHSGGEYIDPADDRLRIVVDSWRGVIPEMHYSQSPEFLLNDHALDIMPDYVTLLKEGHKRGKLRAHSAMAWNSATNDWLCGFLEHFDIMFEGKNKNLAAAELIKQINISMSSMKMI